MNRVVITQMGLVSNNCNDSSDFGQACINGNIGIKECDCFSKNIRTKMFGMTKIKGFNNRSHLLIKQCINDFFKNGVDKSYIEHLQDNCNLFYGNLYCTKDTEYKFKNSNNLNELAYKNYLQYIVKSDLGVKGTITVVNTACASSTTAIGMAYDYIKHGICETAIAGGIDAISIINVNNFNILKNMSKSIINPFDENRKGLNMGEGGALFLLESLYHAQQRHAKILCEIVGYETNNEAYELASSNPNGDGIYNVMLKTLKNSHLSPKDINYINAHGTGTIVNDITEIHAIEKLFNKVNVSSTKALIGHCMGGSGALEIASIIESMKRNQYIPMPNLTNPISDKVVMRNKTFDTKIKYVLKNSFGFSGNNVSMILKAGD